MRVLVTGGAGFIGSHLVRRLVADGHEVAVVDNLSTGFRDSVPPEAEFLELDVSSPGTYDVFPGGPFDAVCHLAAQSSGPRSADDPYADLQTNVAGTLLLSRWSLACGVPRFLYASSMAAYGDVVTSPVAEDTTCQPISYYGVSKLASEHLLRLASRDGLTVTCFRIFSVYGPGQNLANLKQGMVSIYLAYLLRGVPVPVTGALERFRDFVYIEDVVEAWHQALYRSDADPFRIYNVGGGQPTTVRELLAALVEAVGLPPDHPVEELPGSPADQYGLYADLARVRAELDWRPHIPLSDGLHQMVAWARSLESAND